jgi:protein TonB
VIAHEVGTSVGATAASTGDKAAALFTNIGPSSYSRRTTVSLLIVTLHTLVIYGLATGMARKVLEMVPDRIQVSLMSNIPTRDRSAPAPALDPKLGQVQFKIPEAHWPFDVQLDPVTIADGDAESQEFAPSSAPKPVHRVLGGPGQGFPNTGDYYPDASRRSGEKGIATVRVCVDGTGRLTVNPTIAQSSGSPRLDEGALRLAKAGSGHYRATTEDGRPVNGCYAFRVRFELED